jgi:type VI secretion system protein ImpK
MNSNDSNDDSDATRLVGRPTAMTMAPGPQASDATPAQLQALAGMNPLVACASALLAAVPRIRATVVHPDPGGLRESLLQQIAQFERAARTRGVTPEAILVARYAIATTIDETVAGTPWGGNADWVQRSLLVTLHQEAWGGEKFYQLLNKLAEDPRRNIDLIELLYVCLCLGFEGRFRVLENGRAQLDALRERLADMIRTQRGPVEQELSAQWRGERSEVGKSSTMVALWAGGAVAALLLFGVWLWLSFSLNRNSDALAFGALQVSHPVAKVRAAPPSQPLLSRFLAPEIAQGLVEVSDTAGESRVLLRGNDLFESGSAAIQPAFAPIVERVAAALNSVGGRVTVTGHTDDQPIRSARFPSNWKLSQERAQSVLRQMATVVKDPARMSAEGRADQEPLQPNDSEAHRARNRRVEIILRHTGA